MTASYLALDKFQDDPARSWDAIVIGSGIGGMGCAAALAKFGRRCLLLEQHYVPGGFTHTFTRKGYRWDVGVHCVGEMSPEDIPGRLLRWLSDGKIDWQHMGEQYEKFYFPDGFEIDFPANPRDYRKALEAKFPGEKEAIDRYFETIKDAVRDAKPFFVSKGVPVWMSRLARAARKLSSRPDYFARTTEEVLGPIIRNPQLKAVLLGQWGYYGAVPSRSSFAIHAMTVSHFSHGGYYPIGGAQVIAEHLVETIRAAGGQTLVRAPVKEILIENGRAAGVVMENGRVFRSNKVISGAGARLTVDRLLPEPERSAEWARRIGALEASPPHICLHLGIEGDIRAAGGTPANQWFMETWDMEIADWDVTDPKSLAPILYISFPSLKDPHHDPGPEQRHTAEVVTFVPWGAFEKWKETRRGLRNPDYMAFKKEIEERLVAQLSKYVPRILAITKYRELSTPLSTVHFTRALHGGIYGLEATPRRFACDELRTRTPVPGLYLAGSDVATLGITGAFVGGLLAAGSIEPRVLLKFASRPRRRGQPRAGEPRPAHA
jgi:all-trans-retinol 13,14-reductase